MVYIFGVRVVLWNGVEKDTNRCRSRYLVHVGKQPGVGIPLERNYSIRRLVRHQQKPVPGREAEIPGRFPPGGFMCQEFEFPGSRVHGIYDYTVVPPVGSIQEFPVGRDMDIRAGIIRFETPGQGRNRLGDFERFGFRIPFSQGIPKS